MKYFFLCVMGLFFVSCTSLVGSTKNLTDLDEIDPILLDSVHALEASGKKNKYKNVSIELYYLPESDTVEIAFWQKLKKILVVLTSENRQFIVTSQSLIEKASNDFHTVNEFTAIFSGSFSLQAQQNSFMRLEAIFEDSAKKIGLALCSTNKKGEEVRVAKLLFTEEQFALVYDAVQEENLQDQLSISREDKNLKELETYTEEDSLEE